MSRVPTVLIPEELLNLDEGAGSTPNLSLSVIQSLMLLPLARPRLEGPTRGIFVIIFEGALPTRCRFDAGEPPSDGSEFADNVRRIVDNYAVGHVVPVLLCRADPSFANMMIVPLPWAKQVPFCSQCGALLPKDASHAC